MLRQIAVELRLFYRTEFNLVNLSRDCEFPSQCEICSCILNSVSFSFLEMVLDGFENYQIKSKFESSTAIRLALVS